MNIKIGNNGDVDVLLAFNDDSSSISCELYDYIKKEEIFKGNLGEIHANLSPDGKHDLILGLGRKDDMTLETIKQAFFKLGKKLMALKVKSANVNIDLLKGFCHKETAFAVAEGMIQSEYGFEKYIEQKKTKPTLENFYLDFEVFEKDRIEIGLNQAQTVMEGVFLAKDLVNEPALVMTPTKLVEIAEEELTEVGVEVTIMGQKEIEDLGMEAFLSVAKGSDEEPKFLVMEWLKGDAEDETIALVGKGLTYDSGGYSIKPSTGMDTMFTDMAGSASVIGTLKAIAKSNLKKNVVGIVAACENMISGRAYKPGDIIGSMSGKTIEVGNTDAEGRVTLADALWYASTVVKADKIIDVATLTGACIVALGEITTGAVTNDDNLMNDVLEASELAGEYTWELPNRKEYKEMVKGNYADLINTNTGGTGAGAITAGLFLGEFVNDVPWVHLDIAGTAYTDKERGYLAKGATGTPVKTLFNLVNQK